MRPSGCFCRQLAPDESSSQARGKEERIGASSQAVLLSAKPTRHSSPSAISSMSWSSNSSSTFMTRSFLTIRTGVSYNVRLAAHR